MVEIPEGYTPRPLTEDDFEFQYDADHTYTFFENEDGDILTFGHVDGDILAEKASEYYRYVSGGEDGEYDADAVQHTYAVGLDPDGDLLFIACSRTDEFARPITILRA